MVFWAKWPLGPVGVPLLRDPPPPFPQNERGDPRVVMILNDRPKSPQGTSADLGIPPGVCHTTFWLRNLYWLSFLVWFEVSRIYQSSLGSQGEP